MIGFPDRLNELFQEAVLPIREEDAIVLVGQVSPQKTSPSLFPVTTPEVCLLAVLLGNGFWASIPVVSSGDRECHAEMTHRMQSVGFRGTFNSSC